MNTAINKAFDLLRDTRPAATTLVVEATPETLWLYAVRDASGELLWFDEDSYNNHPDAAALGGSPELDYDRDVIGQVQALLRTAEDAAFTAADRHDYQGLWHADRRTLLRVQAT